MNWWLDFVLGVLILAIFPFWLAAYGGHVAADAITESRKRRIVKAKFWSLAVAGLLIAILYQYRTMKTDEARQDQTRLFQQQVNARLDAIIAQPTSSPVQKQKATKLKQLVGKANPANPRLGSGPDAYKDIGDDQIIEWLKGEADKIETLTNGTIAKVSSEDVPANVRSQVINHDLRYFTEQFRDCCEEDLKDLRMETLRRLGPAGKQTDEIEAWASVFPATNYQPMKFDYVHPMSVMGYAPYFRRFAVELRRRTVPRQAPKALRFGESQVSAGHIIATITTDKPISAGYILVEFDGRPARTGCDYEGAVPIAQEFDKLRMSDNKDFLIYHRKVIESGGIPYLMIIGKPFIPEKPIHVEAPGAARLHISKVTLFDE